MIQLKDVCFSYGQQTVLSHISCCMENARITALIGPNGSGKSTCLKLCAGLLQPLSGAIAIDGLSAGSHPPKALARRLAYLPQTRPMALLTVRSLVSHGRFPHLGFGHRLSSGDEAIVERAMTTAGVADLAHRALPSLSGGQRQKAYLAMMLAQETENLLLDEPTTHLDIQHQMELMDLLRGLRDAGRCVVVVLHDLSQALSLCDHVILLHQGILRYSGSPQALLDSGNIQAVFGVQPVMRTEICFERMSPSNAEKC